MKLFFIKVGKALSSIRKNGPVKGGKRVFAYLITFLKSILVPKNGSVLFITGGVGDSATYRAWNQAEELSLHNIPADTTLQDDPFLLRYADKFQVFVFHRTLFTPKLGKMIQKIKDQKKLIIFETDDLVFDPKYIQATDFYQNKMSYFEKKQYEKGVGEEILNDPYISVCSTTTTYLKKILESYGKKVFLSTNKINLAELEVAEEINSKPEKNYDKIRIGYFSGTMSHNKDFATITKPLFQIMEKYPQVELVLVGPLEIENALNKFQDRIIQSELVSRKKHYLNLANIDINLAPLETDNPFCDSKSELKFFEAGIVKVPTVAVQNETFSSAIQDGMDGFLAQTENEWFLKIEKLILDKKLRKEMGEKAYQKSFEDYTTKNSHNEDYYNFIKKYLN